MMFTIDKHFYLVRWKLFLCSKVSTLPVKSETSLMKYEEGEQEQLNGLNPKGLKPLKYCLSTFCIADMRYIFLDHFLTMISMSTSFSPGPGERMRYVVPGFFVSRLTFE